MSLNRKTQCRFCKKEFTSKHRVMCYYCYSKMVKDFKKFELDFNITTVPNLTTVLEDKW